MIEENSDFKELFKTQTVLSGFSSEGDELQSIILFDWNKLSTQVKSDFLSEIYNDGITEDSAKLIAQDPDDYTIYWIDEDYIPFAFLGVDESYGEFIFDSGEDYPQFNQLLLMGTNQTSHFILAISVDGTVVNHKPQVFAEHIRSLSIRID